MGCGVNEGGTQPGRSEDDGRPDRSVRAKIVSLDVLERLSGEYRRAGRRIALAHGVFDLLHMGHVRHLEKARRHADVLIVTITADAYVNKGPDRPVFPDTLRAEMLAALEYVDLVAINPAPTAVGLLERIRPDFYVKGNEYASEDEDITGGIGHERAAVEAAGGRLLFTDDITFSSSELINRHLDLYDDTLRAYLDGLRQAGEPERILNLLDRLRTSRVVLIGDAIIDEYNYVVPMGKSPKENMIATRFQQSEIFAGGVFAAANHIAGFVGEVEVVTCLGQGKGENFEKLIRAALKDNVALTCLYREGTPTTRKSRYIDTGYSMRKLFEVYHMDDRPLNGALAARLNTAVAEALGKADIAFVTDFGHGLIGAETIALITEQARFLAVNAQSNSANTGFNPITKYPRADFICVDELEARLAAADKYTPLEDVITGNLARRIDCPFITVTRGKHGCLVHEQGGEWVRAPALTGSIIDTVGAGDAFFCLSGLGVAAGADAMQASFLGNAAGALKVGIVGHRQAVESVSLRKFISHLLK